MTKKTRDTAKESRTSKSTGTRKSAPAKPDAPKKGKAAPTKATPVKAAPVKGAGPANIAEKAAKPEAKKKARATEVSAPKPAAKPARRSTKGAAGPKPAPEPAETGLAITPPAGEAIVAGEASTLAELSDGVALHEFDSLLQCNCHDPHRLLGAHRGTVDGVSGLVIRAWHPDAERVEVLVEGNGKPIACKNLGRQGIFGAWLPGADFPISYRLRFHFSAADPWTTVDPYHFLPSLGDLDVWLHSEGNHLHAYRKFGAQLTTMNGVAGVSFCVWAPHARRVSVIGTFNNWDGRLNPMRSMGSSGVWELFVPGVTEGAGYKYEILTHDGHLRYKADPYAFGFDLRPSTHSRVINLNKYQWNDRPYMRRVNERQILREPMAVYEVHLGSWMRVPEEGGRWLTYRELAHRLVPHLQRYNFTHIELLPIAEHPFDGSWGYQVTGYYAPTSRFGSPDDFKYFVDYMHQNGIGVIVDWVPAHFPRDDFALRWFDGAALYEHADPRRGEHKDWGTLIFDYGRPEVRNFLISNALFWLDEYHIDGLRVDAVASMLYLDYSRKAGEWEPNKYGGNHNLEAIALLQQLNEIVHREYPGRFTVAEESTSYAGVSRPVYTGGLGFTFKWNMGWMNDTLRYYSNDPVHRKYHQGDLTFALIYQYTENFILPFSHDEVVHGKGSLLGRMPGDAWQKFANLRLLYSYMYAHPGKKLLFMGAEFGQSSEWQYDRSLDWHEAGNPFNRGIERMLESLGWVYRNNREFWLFDNESIGFRWIDFADSDASVLSFIRQGPEGHVICVFNLTPVPRYGYRVGAPDGGRYREIFNSDAADFGGSNLGNHGMLFTQHIAWHGMPHSIHMNIPPLGAVFLKYDGA